MRVGTLSLSRRLPGRCRVAKATGRRSAQCPHSTYPSVLAGDRITAAIAVARRDVPPRDRGCCVARGSRRGQRPGAAGHGRRHGIDVIYEGSVDGVPAAIIRMTGGRGADGVVDAVGMQAHGSPIQAALLGAAGKLPDPLARKAARQSASTGWQRCVPPSTRSSGQHNLVDRRVRRAGEPAPDDGPVREGRDDSEGPGARQALGRQCHAGADGQHDPLETGGRIGCRWSRPRTATRSSAASRTAALESCSSREARRRPRQRHRPHHRGRDP